ncbi:MAG TPA: penicillin acylase family protein, partial [Gemmatimonadaceae bacterium]
GAGTLKILAPSVLMRQVEIRRTTHGVPHIRAENLAAAGYAEAWVQSEDYGNQIAYSLLRARGEMGRWFGHDSARADFIGHLAHDRAVQVYSQVDRETRDIYEGFAAGVDRYIELHPEEFPPGFAPKFTGYDVLAKDVEVPPLNEANAFLAKSDSARRASPGNTQRLDDDDYDHSDDGSNAWAFAPSRTKSGKAILLRNPHLVWTAGYYEAHITVPGVLDFYGDLRVGGPFAVIGGFNKDLGWSTTNNAPILYQFYALDADPSNGDHYMLDGASHAIEHHSVTVEYKTPTGMTTETHDFLRTSLGPVIERYGGKIYVLKASNDLEFRGGEQFLHMMRSHSLAEWKDAMRMRARVNSNFTYADRAGNIFYVWNASLPSLPHAPSGDSIAIPVHKTSDAWSHYVPFDSLPQFLNPIGGYVHNENDAPYYTNMRQPLDWTKYPPYFPRPSLGLRSQTSISLIDNDRKMSLEDVIALKHSYKMMLAERLRDDLVNAVRATNPTGDVASAIDLVAHWDKTVSPESKGSVFFDTWWRRYAVRGDTTTGFAIPWSPSAPLTTPRGLRDPKRAANAFATAVSEVKRRYGAIDVAWGDVHRVRRGDVDVPVGGCASDEGCFRVLSYAQVPDGKLVANGSDGWILAVEFGDEPRAYSVLAYGESPRASSPYFSDQAAMFAKGQLKPVAWLDKDIEAQTVRRYRPGEQP